MMPLRAGNVDVILNDQRRAFSDAYVNHILTTTECYIFVILIPNKNGAAGRNVVQWPWEMI